MDMVSAAAKVAETGAQHCIMISHEFGQQIFHFYVLLAIYIHLSAQLLAFG